MIKGNDYYSKYIKPNLKIIRNWSKKGLTDSEMAKGLEISSTTFGKYKKLHEEFREAVSFGAEINVKKVEAALLKKALGGMTISKKKFQNTTITRTDEETGEEIQEIVMAPVETIIEELAPDVQACNIYLKANKSEKYSEKRQLELSGNADKPIVKEIKVNLGGVSLPTNEDVEKEKMKGALSEEELVAMEESRSE